ncbi:GntR family transcriptional regulator [Streptomyces sp. NBC_01236]|uniref:GntR family transcriptional regulator n=1 Tax=Streptomyces sp. NBC_01236 TaxID=2903789 RepID=UPI002E13FB1D|nr:GntR family transcriptional regulator [Streptomyces sp. NBC_01236]
MHPSADRPAQRAEAAFVSLRTAIVEAALPPGMKLPEDTLAAQYGVSRTLVRAVLARLVAAGLVDSGKAKSATVASPSAEDAKAVFEMRRCLEQEAIRLVAAQWDPAASSALREHVRAERDATNRRDHRLSGRLAAEFHVKLGEFSGNPLLERYLTEVVWRCALILSIYGHPHDQIQSITEHEELIDLLDAGDAERAGRLAFQHIAAVEERALARTEQTAAPDLSAILSRY